MLTWIWVCQEVTTRQVFTPTAGLIKAGELRAFPAAAHTTLMLRRPPALRNSRHHPQACLKSGNVPLKGHHYQPVCPSLCCCTNSQDLFHTLLWPAGLPACQKCWCRHWTSMSLQIGGFYSINHKLYTTEVVSAPPPSFSSLTRVSIQWIFCFLISLSASITVSLPFCFAFFLPVAPYPFPSDWKVKIKQPSYDVAVCGLCSSQRRSCSLRTFAVCMQTQSRV